MQKLFWCLVSVNKSLIYAVLKQWLLQQGEIAASFFKLRVFYKVK